MTVNDSQTPAQATETETPSEFHITDEAAANWYLRKLANIESEKQRVTMQAAQIVKQLENDAQGLRYQYEGELQNFVRQELAKHGNRRKSLTLLQGTAAFRTVPAGLRISDPAAALDFCRKNFPDAVKTAETLDAAKYREWAETLKNAGADALPVGVEATPQREAFCVKFGKAE